MAIRVLVAEDHPVYRRGLVESIQNRSELELVGEATDGADALAQIKELEPDLVLMDLDLPEIDGITLLKALGDEGVATRVLMLSAFTEGPIIFSALEAGAAGYLSKGAAAEEICDAAVAAAAGETVLSPGLEHALAREVAHQREGGATRLSDREREILSLMAEGLSAVAIAERLHLSEGTVRTYIHRAYGKLGVSNQRAAIAEAMRRGILS